MTLQPTGPTRAPRAPIIGALLGMTVLLLLHRYPGIVHDSILYMGEGLAKRSPDIFAHDLFFMHGGQGQYSLMPWLLGMLYQLAPPPQVFLWGTIASLMLFTAASWFVLTALMPERQRTWAWLGILCLPSIYGVVRIFAYNESFLTSRPAAETLALFGMGFLVRARRGMAVACFALAALFHPLQAIAAALVVWPWLVMQDRRWLHALWAILPILLLAHAGIAPFDGLLRPFDPEWLAATRTSRQLFVSDWDLGDYKVLAFDVFLLAAGCRFLPGQWRRWCIAALAGLALGIGASLLLVDGLHLILPAGLQLWRVHWLAHWFAIATLAALLFLHMQARDAGRALLLMLAAQLAWGETTLGMVWMVLLYIAWPWLVMPPRERLRPLLTWVFALGLALLFVNHASNEWKWFAAAGYRLTQYPIDIRLLLFPAIAFALPLLVLVAWQRASRSGRLLLAIGMLPLLVLAAWRWDARRPLTLAFERGALKPDIFGTPLPASAQIVWYPESLVVNWLVLGRASYFSESQLAGQMFNAATFREGRKRWQRLKPMIDRLEACTARDRAAGKLASCILDPAAILQACTASTPQAPLYFVMPYRQPLPESGQWQPADLQQQPLYPRLWLYQCDTLGDKTMPHPSGTLQAQPAR